MYNGAKPEGWLCPECRSCLDYLFLADTEVRREDPLANESDKENAMRLCNALYRGSILPEGHRWSPPGHRQFSLASLVWLLTISAAVLGVGRFLNYHPIEMMALLCLTVGLWWEFARAGQSRTGGNTKSAEELREEIRRWNQGNGDG